MYWIKRIGIYVLGLACMCFGIVFCKRCGMGLTAVSCIPYVVDIITGISFGTLLMIYIAISAIIQMALMKNFKDWTLWLQMVYAVAFGRIVDLAQLCIPYTPESIWMKILFLIISILLMAFGIHLMFQMNLVQNGSDGIVKILSDKWHLSKGTMKVFFDVFNVAVTAVIGLIFLKRIEGIGIATLATMILVGITLNLFRKIFPIKQYEDLVKKKA